MDTPPAWLQTFLDRLAADDLSIAIRHGLYPAGTDRSLIGT